ncbi:MAG TPA: cyclic nucleotide-binding domain-containing protein [Candidatus Dormibacteraeota bacterium]|nr:cyclic nucleotide-binding domain-containing protein [Candidatus Dormibacteraeota bacterium]
MEERADDVVDILAGFALFSDLSTPELENIVLTFEETRFNAEQRVIRQGLTGSGFYVILDGTASIKVDGKDRATLRPGDYFGEISCLLGEAPVSDIVAQRPLRCLTLPCEQLEAFLVAHPRVLFRLMQGEARKVRNTTRWSS